MESWLIAASISPLPNHFLPFPPPDLRSQGSFIPSRGREGKNKDCFVLILLPKPCIG
jgi:hypothetical protein